MSKKPKKMGRPVMWPEVMQSRFAPGTFDRIAEVLEEDEDRTEFVRQAVDLLLRYREERL